MCTVTVHRTSERLLVTMNRDEARDRAPEFPPVVHHDDVAWLAPSDSERGGTWIAVNEFGVVACLMNEYLLGEGLTPAPNVNLQTRGAIIPGLMVRGGAAEVLFALESDFFPEPYPSFKAIFTYGDRIESFIWTGDLAFIHDRYEDDWSFFSSSSWESREVNAWRKGAFDAWRMGDCSMRGHLPILHLLQQEGMREWSPLMDREHSCTRSITQVEVLFDRPEAVMRYWRRDALDAGNEPVVTTLPLRDAGSFAHHG